MKFVAERPFEGNNKNCIGIDFRSIDWEQRDKTLLIWAFPPDHLASLAIFTLVKSEQPAVICVAVKDITLCPWYSTVQQFGAKIVDFARVSDHTKFTLLHEPVRPHANFKLIITKQAQNLSRKRKSFEISSSCPKSQKF